MLLSHAVRTGPTYLVFPVISLSPLVTLVLSFVLLHERTGRLGDFGILLALLCLPPFDYAVGPLFLVYAFRCGKAIVMVPLDNAVAPLITTLLSAVLLGVVPNGTKLAAIALPLVAAVLLAIEPEPGEAATAGPSHAAVIP